MECVGALSILLFLPKASIDTEDVVHLLRLCFVSCDPIGICCSYRIELVEAIITAAQSLKSWCRDRIEKLQFACILKEIFD